MSAIVGMASLSRIVFSIFLRVRRRPGSAHIDEALQQVKPEWRPETDGNRRQRTADEPGCIERRMGFPNRTQAEEGHGIAHVLKRLTSRAWRGEISTHRAVRGFPERLFTPQQAENSN